MASQGRVLGQQLKTMEDNLLPCGRFLFLSLTGTIITQMKQMELMAMRGGFYRFVKNYQK